MNRLHTSPASIAAALRRAADDIEKAGDVELSPVAVQLNLQAVSYRGTSDERKATVDTLGVALVGEPGETEDDDKDAQHHLGFDIREARGDLGVAAFTAVADFGAKADR